MFLKMNHTKPKSKYTEKTTTLNLIEIGRTVWALLLVDRRTDRWFSIHVSKPTQKNTKWDHSECTLHDQVILTSDKTNNGHEKRGLTNPTGADCYRLSISLRLLMGNTRIDHTYHSSCAGAFLVLWNRGFESRLENGACWRFSV